MNEANIVIAGQQDQPQEAVTGRLIIPFQPGYYRTRPGVEVKDSHDVDIDMVYAYTTEERTRDGETIERVKYIFLDSEYWDDRTDFDNQFEYEPDGDRIRRQKLQAIGEEIRELGQTQIQLQKDGLDFLPHVDHEEAGPDSTALVTAGNKSIVAKKALATYRNDVAKLKREMINKTETMKELAEEQRRIVAAQMHELTAGLQEKIDGLQELVKKAESAIWTINLYLGKNEEITVLRKGKAVPKDTQIVIRQLILFMDEECAAAEEGDAEHDGIDARNLEVFDNWLISDPKHLQQVMPEPKGVVALKPRRHNKDYEDPWVNKEMAKANKATYFLIRNGQNLYRIWADFDVGHTLVPSQEDFLDVFYESNYVWKTRKTVKDPILPGSKKYMELMRELDSRHKHYFRIALILQGLLDRTKILHPLPVPHLNILDPNNLVDHETGREYLRFIYDGETSRMLPSGWPTYAKWFKEANAGLCVGQRIMGFFGGFYGDKYSRDTRERRLMPASADYPSSLALHTLGCKGDTSGSFFFYYKRKDRIYRRYTRDGEAKVRGRCTVYVDDTFILNFDAPNVTTEALEHFIASRTDRHGYKDMIPLLKRALQVKRDEEVEEAPFMQLIAGQLMSTYDISREAAEATVPELVHWWKFKNQTHRALTSDDAAALTMIVAEFDIRRRRALERLGIENDPLAKRLIEMAVSTNEGRTVLLVAHKKSNEYVVIVAHNDENIFVEEQLWAINRSSNCPDDKRVRQKKSTEWQLVDTRWERWQILSRDARWDNWVAGVKAKGYLSDPDRERATLEAETILAARHEKYWSSQRKRRDEYDVEDWKDKLIPLGIALHNKDSTDYLMVYYCDREVMVGEAALISEGTHEPSIATLKIRWKRSPEGIVFNGCEENHMSISLHSPPWRTGYKDRYGYDGRAKMMKEWPANIAEVYRQQKLHRAYVTRINELKKIVTDADNSIDEQLDKIFWDEQFAEYKAEYGDDDLWEDHKKTITERPRRYALQQSWFRCLIECNISCDGKTLQWVFEQSRPILKKESEDEALNKRRNFWASRRDSTSDGPLELLPGDAKLVAHHGPIPQGPPQIVDDDKAVEEVYGEDD